jgi:hypothetical protein
VQPISYAFSNNFFFLMLDFETTDQMKNKKILKTKGILNSFPQSTFDLCRQVWRGFRRHPFVTAPPLLRGLIPPRLRVSRPPRRPLQACRRRLHPS